MSAPAAIALRGVTKAFGAEAVLEDLDLEVPAGTLTAILGRSGSGKTTLLRLVAGFERADAGTIALDGAVVAGGGVHLPPERRGLGVVAQEGVLFPHLDVAANVAFGLPRRERRSGRVAELLELVGLGGLGDRRPDELSGGQQQRVALARALAPAPRLVLLDEPFSALDPELRASLRADVRRALDALGTTALLVTHDQAEALSLADQVAVLREGRIVQAGPPLRLYREPADVDVARFLGEANLLPASLRADRADTSLGSFALAGASRPADGERGLVLIRPEQLGLDPAPQDEERPRARVERVEFFGHDALVAVVVEDPVPGLELLLRTAGAAAPPPGSRVRLELPGSAYALAAPGGEVAAPAALAVPGAAS